MAGSSVAGAATSPRTGVPAPRYLAGFLVMAATSWPTRSKAVHNRRPTKPDAPATSTFTGPPEPSLAGPGSAAGPSRNPELARSGPSPCTPAGRRSRTPLPPVPSPDPPSLPWPAPAPRPGRPVTRTLLAYPRARVPTPVQRPVIRKPAAGDAEGRGPAVTREMRSEPGNPAAAAASPTILTRFRARRLAAPRALADRGGPSRRRAGWQRGAGCRQFRGRVSDEDVDLTGETAGVVDSRRRAQGRDEEPGDLAGVLADQGDDVIVGDELGQVGTLPVLGIRGRPPKHRLVAGGLLAGEGRQGGHRRGGGLHCGTDLLAHHAP